MSSLIIDGMHLHALAESARVKIDWRKLWNWAKDLDCGEAVICMIDSKSPRYKGLLDRRGLMRDIGYEVVCQPDYKSLPNVQVRVAIEAVREWADGEDIILIGGATAYLALLETTTPLTVVTSPRSAHRDLIARADKFIDIADLFRVIAS